METEIKVIEPGTAPPSLSFQDLVSFRDLVLQAPHQVWSEPSPEPPFGWPPPPTHPSPLPPGMTLVELLKLTHTFVEAGWCQRSDARDAAGIPVLPGVGMARAWCLRGALRAAVAMLVGDDPLQSELFVRGYQHLQQTIQEIYPPAMYGIDTLETWNDFSGRRQEQVLALVELAITCLK